jgi:hypothetical protein
LATIEKPLLMYSMEFLEWQMAKEAKGISKRIIG